MKKITLLFCMICNIFQITQAMENEEVCFQELPRGIKLHILSYLQPQSKAFNYLMRLYGLTPALALKLIEAYVQKTYIYPQSEACTRFMLNQFKTLKIKSCYEAIRKKITSETRIMIENAIAEYKINRSLIRLIELNKFSRFRSELANIPYCKMDFWQRSLPRDFKFPMKAKDYETIKKMKNLDLIIESMRELIKELDSCKHILDAKIQDLKHEFSFFAYILLMLSLGYAIMPSLELDRSYHFMVKLTFLLNIGYIIKAYGDSKAPIHLVDYRPGTLAFCKNKANNKVRVLHSILAKIVSQKKK